MALADKYARPISEVWAWPCTDVVNAINFMEFKADYEAMSLQLTTEEAK